MVKIVGILIQLKWLKSEDCNEESVSLPATGRYGGLR